MKNLVFEVTYGIYLNKNPTDIPEACSQTGQCRRLTIECSKRKNSKLTLGQCPAVEVQQKIRNSTRLSHFFYY